MKILILLFEFLLIISFNCIAQVSCGSPIICPDKQYPYQCCDKNVHCSNNPNSMTPKPLKAPIPVCLTLDTDPKYIGPINEKMPAHNEAGTFPANIFTRERMTASDGDMVCAQKSWPCICGKQDLPCSCEVMIRFSDSNDDFPLNSDGTENRVAFARIIRSMNPDGVSCLVYCQNANIGGKVVRTSIYLNNTSHYKKVSGDYPSRFFYNNGNYELLQNIREYFGNYHAVNLCDIISHELGHIYGLEHYDEYICPGSSSDGIMNSILPSDIPYFGLSNDDKCAFAKLYCPSVVPVEESLPSGNLTFRQYPNPANEEIIFEYYVDAPVSKVSIKFFNSFGSLTDCIVDNNESAGLHKISYSISSLSAGFYFYTASIGDKIFTNSIIIIK